MSSTYSTLKFELIGTGDQAGSWGATTNTNLGTAVEQAIAGKATCVTADFTSNVATYTLIDSNVSQTARAYILDITATLTAAGTINVPAISKPYIVLNNSVGGFAVTVKVSGQTGVSVPNGKRVMLYNNGTDVGVSMDYLPSLSLGTDLAIADGGTGASTAATARSNLSAAQSGANTDITSLGGLTTPLTIAQGGTNAATASAARSSLGAAASGANSDITSLSGLTTALSVGQGGTGQTSYTNGQLLIGNTTGNTLTKATLTAGSNISITNGTGSITIAASATPPGGSSGQVQFNSSGAFAGDAEFTYDSTTNILSVNSVAIGRGGSGIVSNTGLGNTALAANTTGTSNTAVGAYTLSANTDGYSNTAVGRAALYNNTSGLENTAVGHYALQSVNTGSQLTAVGAYALGSQTNASASTAVGYQAGYSIQSSGSGDFFGYQAGYSNFSGDWITAVGLQSLYTNYSGNYSIGVGYKAGYYNYSGSYNTYVGYQAGYGNGVSTVTAGYNTAIGSSTLSAILTGTYNTVLGTNSGSALTTGGKNVILGGYTGNQNSLDIRTSSNNIVLSDGDGQQRLVINSSGAWSSAATSASYGTSGQVWTSAGNAAVPTWSDPTVKVTQDTSTLTTPFYPLFTSATSGNGTTKISPTELEFYPGAALLKINGVSVGSGGSPGSYAASSTNSVLGANALDSVGDSSSGNFYNTAVGGYALTALVGNLGAGYYAQYNTAVGYNAFASMTAYSASAYTNTALGAGAGYALLSGYNNTFLGQNSGSEITTGQRNVILGSYNGNSGGLDIRTSNNYTVISDGDGNLRCYFASGAMYVPGMGSGAGTYGMKYNTTTKQVTYDTSSARYKDNIRDSVYGLNDVLKMRSAMFEYKDDGRTDVGLIAEELNTIVPELVAKNEQGQPDAVSYDRLVSVLIKAVQDLNDKFEAYKSAHP